MQFARDLVNHPFVYAALLMLIVSTATILADLFFNSATLRDLAITIRRDKLSTALMLVVVYACCDMFVNLVIVGLNLFLPHA